MDFLRLAVWRERGYAWGPGAFDRAWRFAIEPHHTNYISAPPQRILPPRLASSLVAALKLCHGLYCAFFDLTLLYGS